MKKLLWIIPFLILSCKTSVPVTQGETQVTFDGHNLCVNKEFSATINQDSIIKVFTDGFTVGSKNINMSVKYVSGDLAINLHACILNNNGQNICIDQPIHALIPSGDLLAILNKGTFIGNDMANVEIKYSKGTLSIHPNACYKIVN